MKNYKKITKRTRVKKSDKISFEVENMRKILRLEDLLEELQEMEDYREPWKVKHKLGAVVAICLFATLARCDNVKDVVFWADAAEDVLREFLELPNGVPGYDTIRRVLALIEPSILDNFTQKWNELTQKGETEKLRKLLAIDGKTQRGNATAKQKPNHIVSAVDENGICFGQEVVDKKSNEIKAIPKLIERLNIKNHVVTIDAMGTQTEIAKQIIEQKGDYVLGLKGNQGTLHEDVRLYFEDEELLKKCAYTSTTEKARGGVEKREYWVTTDVAWLSQLGAWAGLKSIGMTRNTVTKTSGNTVENRFFISSLGDGDAETFARTVRGHWVVESFHWHLDVTFREDDCQIVDKRAALNLNILRKFAISILKNVEMDKRDSMRTKRFKILLNPMKWLKELLAM
jgi:predicted transposase YbfD/YdcC